MALDRWVALVLLGICLVYGYTAWFTMDGALPPIMKRLAVWPSSFPKVLSIAGIILSLIVVLGIEKGELKAGDIDYRRLHEYKLGQALALLGLMVGLCHFTSPCGFFAGHIRISNRWFRDPWRASLERNDRGFIYRDVWDLVFGSRGAWHFLTSNAIFYGDLNNA
jgi:hypothetical protein